MVKNACVRSKDTQAIYWQFDARHRVCMDQHASIIPLAETRRPRHRHRLRPLTPEIGSVQTIQVGLETESSITFLIFLDLCQTNQTSYPGRRWAWFWYDTVICPTGAGSIVATVRPGTEKVAPLVR